MYKFMICLVSFIIIFQITDVWCYELTDAKPQNADSIKWENITPEEVRQKLDANEDMVLLDVRSKKEFNGSLGRLPGALLIPNTELEKANLDIMGNKDRMIVVYCRSGMRSQIASNILVKKGFTSIKNMTGGILKWNELYHKPYDKGKEN